MDRLSERKLVGDATRRLVQAEGSLAAEQDIVSLLRAWRARAEAADRARADFEHAWDERREALIAADRQIIEEARARYPDLVIVKVQGGTPLPSLCLATGLAIFEGDDVLGNAEAGFGVLRQCIDIHAIDETSPA